MAGAVRLVRRWAVVAVALAACQDAHRVELLRDPAGPAPRVFTWKLVAETAEMADGAFVSDLEAWVVGPYGAILHTGNGGAARGDWEMVDAGTTAPLDRIAAVATAAGPFALVTGSGIVLRTSAAHPGWDRLDLNPVANRRPSLHVADDGRVEAWLATADGFAHAADARTGEFATAAVPPGTANVIFSDDGDSWTVAPVASDCVLYRKPRGEVDWHPVALPPRVQPARAALRIAGLHVRSTPVRGYQAFSGAAVCASAELVVSLQRRKLWLIGDDGMVEWDGQAWTRFEYPADLTAAGGAPVPPGGVSDLLDGNSEVVLFRQLPRPTMYLRPPVNPDAALRADPHLRASAAWTKARTTRFSAVDLWMKDAQVWAAGREGFAHSGDGGVTWTVVPAPSAAPPAAASARTGRDPGGAGGARSPPGTGLRKLALDDRGAQGWAVADDGQVFHFDGEWHAQLRIDAMQHALALGLTDGGNTAWLLTRNKLYRVTAAGATVALGDDRESPETLLVCPDGKTGWLRHGGYHWYAFDGAAWTAVNARPSPACVSAACADALAPSDPDTVVCAAGDQIWSLRQGQTADGVIWQYPIPGLEPLQSHAAELRADSAGAPTRMIAVSQDGVLLRSDGHTDQPAIVDPRATAEGSDVVLSWALAPAGGAPPTWAVEYCVAYVAGICGPDTTTWVADGEIQPAVEAGRYRAVVNPGKLSLKSDTRVRYRIRMTQGELRRKPLPIAEVTVGESPAQTVWDTARPYAAGCALWLALLLGLWLLAPHALLRINDATRRTVSELPWIGNAIGSLAGVVLARKLVRTRRVVGAWTARALRPARAGDPEAPAGEPVGFKTISDPELCAAFEAMPSCQRAWIALYVERAARAFEGGKFARERSSYGEASATVLAAGEVHELPKGVGLEDARGLIAPSAGDPKLVLWIRGQGGVGKSHLACRLARWLFKQALLPHPALVVVIDGNAETREALEAMIRERLEALTQATDVDAGLVGQMLASGHVVPLFDGLTERSPRTIEAVHAYLESPQAPALAICTARSAHGLTARRSVTIEPMPLDADELLPFLSSYRLSLPAAQRRSEELLEPVRRAAKRIAEGERRTPLTPLLVTLLWDEAVAGAAFSSLAVEAFNGYVARALVPAGDAADVAEQRRLALVRARVLGRLALGRNYRPGRWFTRDAAANSLRAANVGQGEHDPVHDFVAAGLLEEDSPGGSQLRFLIDPLSEYLCALSILYTHDGNDPEWEGFLATLDALSPEARVAADGFLVALADCWAAYGSSLQLTRGPRVNDVLPAER